MTDEKPDWLNFYKTMYEHEVDMKEKITTRSQIVFTFVIALITVSTYMLRMLDTSQNPCATFLFYIASAFFYVFLAYTFYGAVRAFWGNEFRYLASAGDLSNYWKELEQWKADTRAFVKSTEEGNVKAEHLDKEVREDFQRHLVAEYINCADHNCKVNQKRQRRLHLSFGCLLLSLIPLAIMTVLFIAFDLDRSSPSKAVRVAGELSVSQAKAHISERSSTPTLIDESFIMTKKNAPESQEKKEPVRNSAPVKPTPPAHRVIMEDFVSPAIQLENINEKK